MLSEGDKVVVGVSGGSDSVGLLIILSELEEYSPELIVAHVNHGLRTEEAARDAEFVGDLARKYGLKFEHKEVDTYTYSRVNKLSVEEAARELRYNFFYEVLKKYCATKIATAHTVEDQAETVLIRIIRGSGTTGISAIPPVSNSIIRPLINTRRGEIRDYLSARQIGWQEDSTNLSEMFLRNRIRQGLIPVLKKYNPNIISALSNLSFISKVESDYIGLKTAELSWKITKKLTFGIVSTVSDYLGQHQALRLALLRHCTEAVKGDLRGLTFNHIISADKMLLTEKPSGKITLPDDLVVARGYDYFCIANETELVKDYSFRIDGPGRWILFPGLEIEVDILDNPGTNQLSDDQSTGHFSADKVKFPIEICSYSDGDRFIPLGMSDYKKLKNLFIDCKIPRFFRKRIPVFRSEGEIFWVGGVRVDERCKVVDTDHKILRIKLVRSEFRFSGTFRFA